MSNVVSLPASSERPNARSSDRGDALISAIKVMFGELTPAQQEKLRTDLEGIVRPIPAPRAGDVLGAVIRLFPKQPEWTVQELLRRLEEGGVEHTTKEVYNALGYLTRKQKIQRTGHGRYSIGGVPVVTSDELGGAGRNRPLDPAN